MSHDVHDGRQQGDDEAEMDPDLGRSRSSGNCAKSWIGMRDRRGPARAAAGPATAAAQKHDLLGDRVEHDRRDDLMGARLRLEDARDEAPRRATDDARRRARAGRWNGPAAAPQIPTQTANIAPILSWPSAPMLKTPERNATATAETREDQRRRGEERFADRAEGDADLVGVAGPERGDDLARVAEGARRCSAPYALPTTPGSRSASQRIARELG